MAIHFAGIATFIHIPKCAGTSVTEWSKKIPGHNDQKKHVKVKGAVNLWPTPGRFFAVVRDPWDRAISLYHFLGQMATGQIPTRRQYGPYPRWKELYGSGLVDFLTAVKNRDTGIDVPDGLWHVWDTQTSWIEGATDVLILRQESLNQDFEAVKKMLHHNHDLPTVNTSEHADFRTYYNDASVKLVREIWAQDIERFGYTAP